MRAVSLRLLMALTVLAALGVAGGVVILVAQFAVAVLTTWLGVDYEPSLW